MNLKYLVKYIEKKSFLCLLLQEDLIFEDVDEIVDDELQKINFSMLSNNARVKIVKQCNKFLLLFFQDASPRKSSMPLFQCQPITLKQAKVVY